MPKPTARRESEAPAQKPDIRLPADAIRAMLSGRQPTIYGDGKQSRDFTFVANVVHGNLLAADADGVRIACGSGALRGFRSRIGRPGPTRGDRFDHALLGDARIAAPASAARPPGRTIRVAVGNRARTDDRSRAQ